MKNLLFAFCIIFSFSALSDEEMKCGFDGETIGNMIEVMEIQTPLGLYAASVQGIDVVMNFYYDQGNDKIGIFRSVRRMQNHSYIGLCLYGSRTFVTEDGEFFEYYITSGNLNLSNEEFDPEFPEARSEFEFMSLAPATINVK